MGDNKNQGQATLEGWKNSVQTAKSNLSETAKLVNYVMINYITPVLRNAGLVMVANEIIKEKLNPEDPKVIAFATACREQQAEIYEKAKREGRSEKELAVVSNYFAKLIGGIKNSSTKAPEPAAPVPNLELNA